MGKILFYWDISKTHFITYWRNAKKQINVYLPYAKRDHKKLSSILVGIRVHEFPKIHRFITEWPFVESAIFTKFFLVSFFCSFTLIAILLQFFSLEKNQKQVVQLLYQRAELTREISYWKGITDRYKDYRDGFFKIAILEYQLGNIEEAKANLEKALSLDPSFEAGKHLQQEMN